MIYVSSSCVKSAKIKDSVVSLAENGIKNIELSGGSDFYNEIKTDLISLKNEFELNCQIHNYFPPPEDHFVLNLASLDEKLWGKCIDFYKNTIEMSLEMGSKHYGIHGGFYLDPQVCELGKNFVSKNDTDKKSAIEKFATGFELLKSFANNEINLYVENNVLSFDNYKNYAYNPFMLTTFEEYEELKILTDFKLLLDVAHLKVSSNTLNLDFDTELKKLLPNSNYLHLSDNDGKNDLNLGIDNSSELLILLKKNEIKGKIITLETYIPISEIKRNIEILNKIIDEQSKS